MKPLKKIIIKTSGTVFLFLFVGFYFSVTSFYHQHFIDGRAVYHSHPFLKGKTDKNSQPLHSHSAKDFNYILGIDKALWEANVFFNCEFERPYSSGNKIDIFNDSFTGTHTWLTNLLRAPPPAS